MNYRALWMYTLTIIDIILSKIGLIGMIHKSMNATVELT